MCSTVNGYEGTGRSLSLKLIQQLREQAQPHLQAPAAGSAAGAASQAGGAATGRVFKEVELAEPIRYAPGDPIESWLSELLCLDATSHIPPLESRLPHPTECELFYVNRDTLFSYHKASEHFLQRMMALYVSSHYKNTPNDLQLMSDAPAHHLFVLLGPVEESQDTLPDVLCVLQVCLEGAISRQSAVRSLSQGLQPTGDLIPWTVSQQFQDAEFPSLSGARIVRIAVHPELIKQGYGSRAVELLSRYYEGQLSGLGEDEPMEEQPRTKGQPPKPLSAAAEEVSLLEEQVKPRADLPPLLLALHERRPERLHYVGASFGLTQGLFNFWRKLAFAPVYVRQTASEVTGEHTCIVLRPLQTEEVEAAPSQGPASWLHPFAQDFRRRFISLLGYGFRSFAPALALSILDPKIEFSEHEARRGASLDGVVGGPAPLLSPYDMKRLESYASNLVDYHLVLDLVPAVARLYFLERIPASLSYGQAAILLSLGLQHQELSAVEAHLRLASNQVLALFNKAMRKIHGQLHAAASKVAEAALPRMKEVAVMRPHARSVEEDLDEGAQKVKAAIKEQLAGHLKPEDLQQFAIAGREHDIDEAIERRGKKLPKSGLLSVKAQRKSGGGGGGGSGGGGAAAGENGTADGSSEPAAAGGSKGGKQKKARR